MLNLLVLTDAGKNYGFGHITRTISISQIFEKNNYSISYIIDSDESIESFMQNYTYKYKIFNWKKDINRLINNIKKNTLILIDSLEIEEKELLLIENTKSKIIFFDDENRRNILNNGFVIDWTILSDERNFFFPRKKEVKYFLGSKYTLLRKEFFSSEKKKLSKSICSIMISFGGSDIRNLTPKILKFFVENYPHLKKNVIIGPGYKNIDEIKNVADSNTYCLTNLNTKDMIKYMKESDVAISAGGQTLYELAFIGIPTIALLLIDNAKDDTLGWASVGFLEYIGLYNDDKLIENLQKAFIKVQNYENRISMIESANKYLPKNGKNFVDIILQGLT